MFLRILTAHDCARKFTCHVMYRARAPSTKMNNDRALPGFNDLGRSVTPTFLSRNRFYLQLSPHCSKMNKKSMWEKISRFLSTGHGILPSCGCKARETVVSKCELILWGTSPVGQIRLIGPFKPYLAENISLQSSNSNILDLQPMWPSSLTKPDLLRVRCSSGHVLSKTKSVTPHFYLHFWHH